MTLFLIGLIDVAASPTSAVRLDLIEVVPLGIGAALANQLLGRETEQNAEKEERW